MVNVEMNRVFVVMYAIPCFRASSPVIFFLLSALLRELGSLCWDRGYGAIESTRDAALLGSSRAGTERCSVYQNIAMQRRNNKLLSTDCIS